MKQTDKYKVLAVLVRGFFEGFTSGILDGQRVGRSEKNDPKTVKKAMLDHYESIAPEFHDLLFYPIATMNFDCETITARLEAARCTKPTPEQLLQMACSDDAMHRAVVAEYRRNLGSLLEGRLPTEQEHLDNYTRGGGQQAQTDTKKAIHRVVKTAVRAYTRGLKRSGNGQVVPDKVSVMLLLINTMNLLMNDSPIETFASQAQTLDEVMLKACGSERNIGVMMEAMRAAYKEMAME